MLSLKLDIIDQKSKRKGKKKVHTHNKIQLTSPYGVKEIDEHKKQKIKKQQIYSMCYIAQQQRKNKSIRRKYRFKIK